MLYFAYVEYGDHINRFFGGNLSAAALEFLAKNFQLKSYAAKEMIVSGGDRAKYFYIVSDGVQAIYLIDKKGDKVVFGFSYTGSVSGVYDSFLEDTPSHYFLEALTPSQMLALDRASFIEMFERFPELKDWKLKFIDQVLLGRGKREVEFLTLSAKERFDAFMKRCPDPLLQIPQKYLASYLNMKPETFSRLRAQRD